MKPSLFILLAVAAATLVITLGFTRVRAAAANADAASVSVDHTLSDSRELVALRSKRATRSSGEEPAQDTLGRVTAALADCGIPSARLKSLEREADTEIQEAGAGPRLRTLSMRITLEPVTVTELASFLSTWQTSQSLWSVTRIELTHSGPADEREGTYAARLVISAVYIPQGNGKPDTASPARSSS